LLGSGIACRGRVTWFNCWRSIQRSTYTLYIETSRAGDARQMSSHNITTTTPNKQAITASIASNTRRSLFICRSFI
jgi:hypothetical protein